MKKKNLLPICAASSFCLLFVLILIWSMSIYAEKSGTQNFEPEIKDTKSSDMLTNIIKEEETKDPKPNNDLENVEKKDSPEDSATKDIAQDIAKTKGLAEEKLNIIWKKMHQEYDEVEKDNLNLQEEQDNTITDDKISSNWLDINDAGLILLKEINRLYPQDSLEDLKISYMILEYPYSNVVYWTGKLENGYGPTEENYKSYSCQINPISGKIVSFGKFHPYQKDKDYSLISWTDDKIKEHAKQLIEKYDLSQGEELDWDTVEIYSGQEEINSLKKDFEERPNLSICVCNTLVFEKDGLKHFYFCIDWETGEINNYLL